MKGVHIKDMLLQSEYCPRNEKRQSGNTLVEDNLSFFVYSIPCILSILCYSNILNGDFVHDDIFAIQNNPDVTGQGDVSDIWRHDFWGKPMSSVKSHKSYRPLTILLFRLDYLVSQGNPTWFHVVNTSLHACVTLLVAHLCMHVLYVSQLCSVLAASLFAVHPIHTEAVSSIVGRADVLAGLLFLISFIAYTRCIESQENQATNCDRQVPHPYSTILLASSLILAVVASLCKETGFTVLGACVLYDVIKHRHLLLRLETPPTQCHSSLCHRLVAVAVTGVLFLSFRGYIMDFQVPIFLPEDNPASYSESFLTRVLTFHYLLPCNLWLLVCPRVLCYDWQIGSIPLVESFADPRNVITLAFYVTVFAIAYSCVHFTYRDASSAETESPDDPASFRTSMLMAGVLLCVPFIPASNLFFTVGFVVAERVLYIPSIGFCIFVSQSIVHLCASMPKLKGHILTLSVLLIITFAGRTWQRNPIWASRKALFMSGIETMPSNAKVHFNIANYYKDVGKDQLSINHYKKAIQLYPRHPSYHNNLGTLLTNRTESEHHFRRALTIYPNHKGALVNLGNLLILQGQVEGFELLSRALEIDPEYVNALLSMGKALMAHNRSDEAEKYIQKAILLKPDMSDAHDHYGALHQQIGRLEHAVTEYQQAFTLNSRNTNAMKNAAITLRKLRRYSEAELLLKRAMTLEEDCDLFTQLGILYSAMGQNLDALFAYKEALILSPNNTLTNLRYVQALVDTNQHSAANQSLTNLLGRASNDLDVLRFAYTHKQQMGLEDEALPYLEDAILQAKQQRHASLGKLYLDKADIYRGRSDFHSSLKFYKLSVEEDPTIVESYINIGTIYHIQANYSQAEEYYLKALSLNPVNVLAKENMTKLRNVWKGSSHDKR